MRSKPKPYVERGFNRSALRPMLIALAAVAVLGAVSLLGVWGWRHFSAPPSAAELPRLSLQEVIDLYLASKGGAERLRSAQALAISGVVASSAAQEPMRLEMIRKKPGKVRYTLDHSEGQIVFGHDGRIAWQMEIRKSARAYAVKTLQGHEREAVLENTEMFNKLIDWPDNGARIQPLDPESLEGRPCYRLFAVLPDGRKATYWMDAESFRILKRSTEKKISRFVTRKSNELYSDFKKIDGIWLPHRIETAVVDGEAIVIDIESYQVDPSALDSLFERPPEPAVKAAPEAGSPAN